LPVFAVYKFAIAAAFSMMIGAPAFAQEANEVPAEEDTEVPEIVEIEEIADRKSRKSRKSSSSRRSPGAGDGSMMNTRIRLAQNSSRNFTG
jgi:hypothetical protein